MKDKDRIRKVECNKDQSCELIFFYEINLIIYIVIMIYFKKVFSFG